MLLSVSQYPFKLGCFKFKILIVISWQPLKKTKNKPKKTLKNTYKMITESKQYKTTEKMIKEKR